MAFNSVGILRGEGMSFIAKLFKKAKADEPDAAELEVQSILRAKEEQLQARLLSRGSSRVQSRRRRRGRALLAFGVSSASRRGGVTAAGGNTNPGGNRAGGNTNPGGGRTSTLGGGGRFSRQ